MCNLYSAMCEAGSFYSDQLDTCLLCGRGSHASLPGRTFCTNCPGQSTLRAGSTSKDQCVGGFVKEWRGGYTYYDELIVLCVVALLAYAMVCILIDLITYVPWCVICGR